MPFRGLNRSDFWLHFNDDEDDEKEPKTASIAASPALQGKEWAGTSPSW